MDIKINNLNDLKLFSASYASIHESVSIEDKKIIFNFIKEANEEQLHYLLTAGQMVKKESEKLNEIGMSGAFGKTIITLSKGESQIAAGVAAAALIYLAIKASKKLADSTDPAECKQYKSGSEARKKCLRMYKANNVKRQIQMIKSKMSLCNNSRNPEKCKFKLKNKIRSLEVKVKALSS